MRMGGWRPVVAAALALTGTVGTVGAQTERRVDEVRACLCKEQSVSLLNADVQAQSRAYEEKRREFEALDKQVQTGRPQVNVNKQTDVDAFKQLLERRDAAADTLAGPATRSYADTVQRYNEAVTDYNGTCAGKAFDPDQLAAEKRNLACPKP
jgi:phage-related tail protein